MLPLFVYLKRRHNKVSKQKCKKDTPDIHKHLYLHHAELLCNRLFSKWYSLNMCLHNGQYFYCQD